MFPKFLKIITFCVLVNYNVFASFSVVEKQDLDQVYPLYQQLNTWITLKEFKAHFDKAQNNEYHLYQLVEDGKIIGLVGYQFINQLYCGRYMHVDSLVVDKDHRKQGYGKKLNKFLIEKFKKDVESNNCKRLAWETGAARQDAIKFYETTLKLTPSPSHYYAINAKDIK